MANPITARSFPGVYSTVIDRSFVQPQASRFRAGLIGVARKGAFDTPLAVRSFRSFVETFGQPIAGEYFLANAVAILSDLSDGMQIVRVGNRYTEVASVEASGTSGGTTLTSATGKGQIFSPAAPPYGQGADVYITVKEAGKPSTVNVEVTSASSGTISIAGNGTLAATYTNADVSYSNFANAANVAEGFLYAYTYGTVAGVQVDQAVAAAGSVTGNKGDYQFTISGNYSSIQAGDLLKIKQPDADSTAEVRVRQVTPDGTVYLETTDLPDVGYQALSLQDSYGAGSAVYKATGRVAFLYLEASSAGDWANGDDATTGLFVKVLPGSSAGSKKLEIYEASGLVETIDDLSDDPASANFYTTRINGLSQYIQVVTFYNPANQYLHAANMSDGWNTNATPAMPLGRTNAGGAIGSDTGGNFHLGYNGEAAQNSDYVGTYEPSTDTMTGLKVFEDTRNIQVDVLCAPGVTDNVSTISVHQEMARIAKRINALALIDVPAGINARQAIDWHNGKGLYTGRGRLNTAYASVFWNWFTLTDPFTGNVKSVPPTLAALRCLAFTFDRDKPWYAAAGDIRGLIPEALSVEFPRVSEDTKAAMYGNGQSVNPILWEQGQAKLFGERTMQVAESKLSVNHNVILVNYIVVNLALIFRRFVFDPNDPELLTRMRLAGTQFLDKVANERGLENYLLVIDDTNNTAETRNRREAVVDLAIVPTESVERIYVNTTVRESGALLGNNVTITG